MPDGEEPTNDGPTDEEKVTKLRAGKKAPQDFKRGKKKPVQKTVWICMDPEIADEYAQVNEAYEFMKRRLSVGANDDKFMAEYDEAKRKEQEMREVLRDNSTKFVFRGIGMRRFDKLVDKYPPTDHAREQIKKQGGNPDNLRWDPDTFGQALCEASCIEPEGCDFDEIFESDDWNDIEIGALIQAAIEANGSRQVVPAGNV